jgi:hypothetical protein
MEYLWMIVLGLGVMFLMSCGRGGMGCRAGGHGDHHSKTSEHDYSNHRAFRDAKRNVTDLREDEYMIIPPKQGRLPRSQGDGFDT